MKQRTKHILNRCTAVVLSVVMLFTAVRFGWANTPEITAAAKQPATYTAAGLVAENYAAELSAEELAILNHAAIASTEYVVSAPSAEDGLTEVDSENLVIYAKNFTDGDYTWVPETAEIVVGEETLTTVNLTAGDVTYDGASYDASATFACDENGYQVIVNYALYIEVTAEEQTRLINMPFWMADAMNNMNSMKSVSSTLNTIIRYGAPELKQYVDGSYFIQFTGRTKEIVLSWLDQKEKYNGSELSNLLNQEGGYNTAEKKIENILTNGAAYKECATTVYDDFYYIQTSTLKNVMDADMFAMLSTVTEGLEPAGTSDWDLLTANEASPVLKEGAEYGNLDALVEAALEGSVEHTPTIQTKLLADTAAISCSVNRYNVAVTVNAEVYEADGTTTTLTFNKVLNLASGLTKDDVVAAIAADGVESESLADWNDGTNYAINDTNYERTVESTLSDTLETDAVYVITYSPKAVKADIYEDGALAQTIDAYFGSIITFPKSEAEGKSYEYTLDGGDGTVYEQGTTYRMTGDTSFTRVLGKEKAGLRVYDLAVDYYGDDLSPQAEAILKNLAVNSEYIYIRMIEDNLLSFGDDGVSVTAKSYDAGNGMFWQPTVLYVKNGSEIVQTITELDAGGTAVITAVEYTSVEAAYELKVDVTDAEVLEALNLPYALVTDAVQQLDDLETLASYEANIDQVTYGMLDLVSSKLNAASQAAIAEISANGCNADGSLILSTYIDGYKACTTDAARLNYYYSNKMYDKIKTQIELIADSMAVIVEDPALPALLESLGYGQYVEKLENVADSLEALKDSFPAKHDKINVSSGSYEALLDAILAGVGSVSEYTTQDGLYCTATIAKAASDRAIVKLTVQIVNGEGIVVATKTYEDDFLKNVGMTAEDIAIFESCLSQFETELSVNKDRYTCTQEGKLPQADAALKNNVNIVYTWAPNTYTVVIEGEGEQTFTYDNMRITLPASDDQNVKYYYTVGDKVYEVLVEDTVITLTEAEFEALYGDNMTYTITRTAMNVEKERIIDFVASLNKALVDGGLSDAASFVALEDANGSISIVLRMNLLGGGVSAALTEISLVLVSQAYVELGGEALKDSAGIHMDVLIDALLHSGIGTERLTAMITEDGDIVENVKDKVLGQTVIQDALSGVTATDALGGLLMETTLRISNTGDNLPFFVSWQDYNQNAGELKALREDLIRLSANLTFECADGKLNLDMTAPDAAFEAYMALMLPEGAISLDAFATPSFIEVVDFAKTMELETVITDESVTAQTVMNTIEALSPGTDMSSFEGTITTLLDFLKPLLDEDLTNGDIASTNDADTAKDTYNATVSYPMEALIASLGLSEAYASFLVGEPAIPMEMTLSNCNDTYEAVVIDAGAADALSMIQFTKDAAATVLEANDEAMVVLLKDVESLTADAAITLNLNGFTLGTLRANAAVTVADSRIANADAGSIENISGDVTIVAGIYASDINEYLPEGYEQDSDGLVSNIYYNLVEDADGSVTLEIKEAFFGAQEDVVEKVSVEMTVDMLFDAYTWAGVTVTGNSVYNIYSIELFDLMAQYESGMGVMMGNIVEEIDCAAVSGFINDLLGKLSNFTSVARAIETDKAIAKYTLTTAPWKLYLSVEGEGKENFIAGNLATGTKESCTLSVKVVGDNKAELVDTFEALGEVVTFNELTLTLHDLTYDGSGIQSTTSAAVGATIDFGGSEKPYIAAIGIIMAYGTSNFTELVEAVNVYLTDGTTAQLVAAIEKLTTAQMITAFKKADGVSLATMTAGLGITNADSEVSLNTTYRDVLAVSKLVTKLGIRGGSEKLATYATGEYATYEGEKEIGSNVTAAFELILCGDGKPVIYPNADIQKPTVTVNGTNIYGATVSGSYIYLDVKNSGITETQFKNLVTFGVKNGAITSTEFSGDESKLVCTGDKVTVKAQNNNQPEPVVDSVTYTIIIVGDTNKDGKTTVSDASQVIAHSSKKVTITGVKAKAADANNSKGSISVSDASLILNKITNEIGYESKYK